MSTTGAADAMHVVFRVHGEIKVHHVRDPIHVDATRGNVGRHQHAHLPRFEVSQCLEALVLGTVRVERSTADVSILFQLLGHLVGTVLGASEDQHHLQLVVLGQQMLEQVHLQMTRHFIDMLGHRFSRIGTAADLHCLRRALELIGERLDLLRQRGGEQQ